MSDHFAFALVTVFPFLVLVTGAGVSILSIKRLGTYKLLLLPAILLLMAHHQAIEGVLMFRAGESVGLVASEVIETGANVLASGAVYYGVNFAAEKQQLADRVAESEQRYRTVTERSPLPVFVVQDGEIVFANQVAASMLGVETATELHGRKVDDFRVDREINVALPDGGTAVETNGQRWVDANGESHTVVVFSETAKYQGQESLYLICRDITERREYKENYQRTKAQLETALENSNDAILLIDPIERSILDANRQAFEMLGYDREELIGLPPEEVHPHESERLDVFFDRVLTEKAVATDTLSCMRRDGSKIPVDISASATQYDSRECVMAIVRDQTERQQRRKQVEVLQRILRHNLRNEMTVIMGHAHHIEEAGSGQASELAKQIEETAESLLGVTETVRDIQGIIERETIQLTDINLPTVIEKTAQSVESDYPNATIETAVRETVTVQGTELLEHAITELVENAIEHNDSDRPWVKIDVSANGARRGHWIDVSIIDNGPGIPSHEQTAVQMNVPEDPLSHGSGMGLWKVNQIVEAVDGELSIENHPDGGSIVTLHLRGHEFQPDTESVSQ